MSVTPAASIQPVGFDLQAKAEVVLSDDRVLDVSADDAINWSASNPAVAAISSSGTNKGMVTGVSAGMVTITSSGEANGQHFSATAEVARRDPFGSFIQPETIARNWANADAYCKGLIPAARLPTRAELRNLFIQSTSTDGSYSEEMCSVHGWPLSAQCGGTYNDYWASEVSETGSHYSVNMLVTLIFEHTYIGYN